MTDIRANPPATFPFYDQLYSQDADYAVVQGGSVVFEDVQNPMQVRNVGGFGDYTVVLGYVEFDTNGFGGASGATLKTRLEYAGPASTEVLQFYAYDWGGDPLGVASWRTPTQLQALTLLCELPFSSMPGAYADVTVPEVSPGLLLANLNGAGFTRMVVALKSFVDETTPTDEDASFNLDQGYTNNALNGTVSLRIEVLISETGANTGIEGVGLTRMAQKRKPQPRSFMFANDLATFSVTGGNTGFEGIGVKQGFFQRRRPVKAWPHIEDPQLGGMTLIERPIEVGSARFTTRRPPGGTARIIP